MERKERNSDTELASHILEVLKEASKGLEISEIARRLGKDRTPSERWLRAIISRLADEGKVVKRRRASEGVGAPPYTYYHADVVPRQPSIPGLHISDRTEIETAELDEDERRRQLQSRSVLGRIAAGFIRQEMVARAVMEVASRLRAESPHAMILEMAEWVVGKLNIQGSMLREAKSAGRIGEAERMAQELELRLQWTKRLFRRFWRLDRSTANYRGILELPDRARDFDSEEASFDRSFAADRLRSRIIGDRVLEIHQLNECRHTYAAGSDASVADIYLEHTRGSFVPPDPVAVMTAGASLKARSNGRVYDYHEFDVYPDRLKEYEDTQAAANGLVISPIFRSILPEQDFRHARMAAMDLRQYSEDLRIVLQEAKWRPMGDAPLLGYLPRPSLLIRDGRIFPLVHRLRDYEYGGLYGVIVRGEIEKFRQVLLYVLRSPHSRQTYGAAVKSPELSWLAPLVFWYLHTRSLEIEGARITEEEVFRTPLADTAVAHLLFLGMAKEMPQFPPRKHIYDLSGGEAVL